MSEMSIPTDHTNTPHVLTPPSLPPDLTTDPTTTTYVTAGSGTALTCKMVVDTSYSSRSLTWYLDDEEVRGN